MKKNKPKRKRNSSTNAKTKLEFARALFKEEHFAEVEKICADLMNNETPSVDVSYLRAHAAVRVDNFDLALRMFELSVELDPQSAPILNDLGNTLDELNRPEEAIAAYQKAITIQPELVVVHINLGILLQQQKRYEAAISAFQVAAKQSPEEPTIYYRLGLLYKQRQQHQLAIEHLEKCLERDSEDINALKALCSILRQTGDTLKLSEVLQAWINVEPDNPVPQHLIQSLAEESTPTRASDEYVQQVFDKYSETFDDAIQELGYRMPEIIAEQLQSTLGEAQADLMILDAGCGTGLCAQAFRPYAKELIGVDLSPGMIEKAELTGAYDQLIVGELTEYLSQQQDAYHLVLATDTFNYLGDLEPVFQAAFDAIKGQGRLVFTLEMNNESEDERMDSQQNYRLNVNGRYSHSVPYIEKTLTDAGFSEVSCKEVVLRQESSKPVKGLMVGAVRV